MKHNATIRPSNRAETTDAAGRLRRRHEGQMASLAGPLVVPLPDGLEFPPGASIGVSRASGATGYTFDCALLGFEY